MRQGNIINVRNCQCHDSDDDDGDDNCDENDDVTSMEGSSTMSHCKAGRCRCPFCYDNCPRVALAANSCYQRVSDINK